MTTHPLPAPKTSPLIDQNISAITIYDGNQVHIPDRLLPTNPDIGNAAKQRAWGLEQVARAGQFQGTPLEQLCEVAGRACYDSFGRGRNSADYHQHIETVGHGSVWEHANFTIDIDRDYAHFSTLVNRPGVFVIPGHKHLGREHRVRVTVNLRAVAEWYNIQPLYPSDTYPYGCIEALRFFAGGLAPQIKAAGVIQSIADTTALMQRSGAMLVEPEHDEEKWVSMLLTGSRGMSHEQVRHGDRTAISQRSTRFVDEDGNPWVEHPLISLFLAEEALGNSVSASIEVETLRTTSGICTNAARTAYATTVQCLEPWLIARGVDKQTARKQARGAARGYLGNALYTEVVFSASVAQWKRMLKQRCSRFADAEIRCVYNPVLMELKRGRYADCFNDFSLVPSPDDIGQILAE